MTMELDAVMRQVDASLTMLGTEVQAFISQFQKVDQYPDRLYHFTDFSGLLGILKTQKLWASLATSMNDSSECDMWREEVPHCLRMAAIQVSHFDREDLASLLEANVPTPGVPFYDSRSYVVSFCPEQNSSIHWLHYGRRGTGLAIRFNPVGLKEIPQFTLAPAIYSADTRRRLLEGIIQRVDRVVGELVPLVREKDVLRATLAQMLSAYIKCAAPQLKDGAFVAEQEWRLFSSEVFRPEHSSGDPARKTMFRTTPNKIIPYKEVDFDKEAIEEVVLGHSCPLNAHKQAIEVLMEQGLGRAVPVRQSGVPVRP